MKQVNKRTFGSLVSLIITMFLNKLHDKNILPSRFSLFVENLFSLLRGLNVRFSYCPEHELYCASEGKDIRYFENLRRGFWLYRGGIVHRGEFIFGSYCLENIEFSKGDIVIDCGANSGDLFIALRNCIDIQNYYAIEPNPSDFKILQLNTEGGKLLNIALGESDGSQRLWVSTEGGDSSLIEPEVGLDTIEVSVEKLDSVIEKLNIQVVKLLKLEAEGYEPEILKGLKEKLESCKYIAIDGGYERGKGNEQTFTEISNFLIQNNFEMVDIYFPWCRAIFRNRGTTARS